MKKKRTFRNILKVTKSAHKSFFATAFIGVLYTIVKTIAPAFLGVIVASLSSNDFDTTLKYCMFYLIISGLISITMVIYDYSFWICRNKIVFSIRSNLSKNLLNLEAKEFDNASTGTFLTRMTEDPENIADAFNSVRNNILRGIANIAVLAYCLYLSPVIGGIYLISLITVFIITKIGVSYFIKYKKIYMKKLEKGSSIFSEIIRGIKDIKTLNLKPAFIKHSDESYMEMQKYEMKFYQHSNRYHVINEFVKDLTTIIVILVGVYLITQSKLTIATLLVLFMYKDNIYDLITCFSWLKESIEDAKLSIKRIEEITHEAKYKKEKFGSKSLKTITGNIEFKDVTFHYDKDNILNNFNLKVKANDTVALVGKSGAGKSTIFNLLTRSYQVSSGTIYIDKEDIDNLNESSLRNHISLVSQNPYIFNMSIIDNLRLIKPKASKKEIERVCKLAEIHEYIMTLEKQYDTIIGEGGLNLSGGQKQRLSIARSLLRDTKIILFDEATSALDNETQNKILSAIHSISKDYTIIIIAHRLSTIKICNKIYVVDEGRVSAEGTHDTLMKQSKLYKTLYENEIIE